MSTWLRLLMVGLMLAMAASCNRQSVIGPPQIRYGQDACTGCGMIVSDDRFAAAIINPDPDGAPLVFDDIGCLLTYERKNPACGPWTHYFHDATSHQWVKADEAAFVKTSRETPMGSGIVALQSPSDTENVARAGKGAVCTFAELLHESVAAAR